VNGASDSLSLDLDLDLIGRLDRNGPRYTSYPTADRFVEAFGAEKFRSWVEKRNIGGLAHGLSIYVHLPFCSTVCFYCACNKIATRNRAKAATYLDYLARELALQASHFEERPPIEQMHWGGGTPTFYDAGELAGLFALLRSRFSFAPDGEYSIEVDPRTVDADAITALRAMGFNRVSFGVQDFNPEVQRAVNRLQSVEQTLEIVAAARAARFRSINVDLIYGLPRQSLLSFNATLATVIRAQPERVAVYNYAHLPSRFTPQRRINEADLPSPEMKLKLLALAARRLTDAGYVYIGMDHFARPDDALAIAQRRGRLHRNFQGYSTRAGCDLIALGVSAIGSMGPTYFQNHRGLDKYYDSLARGVLPIARGIELTADDLVRRAVIQALMCQFEVSKEAIGITYLMDFDRYFAAELVDLAELQRDGLVVCEPGWIHVTPKGRALVRNVCMIFDRYLRHERQVCSYSRVI